jgi:hypothetical protein
MQELETYLEIHQDLRALCEAFEDWIVEGGLAPKFAWLTPLQCSELKLGAVFAYAQLVLIFTETQLESLVNYKTPNWITLGFSDVAEKFGYSGMLGNTWSVGFHKVAYLTPSAGAEEFADHQEGEVRTYRLQ